MGNFCHNCGAELKEGQRFCLSCGFAVQSSVSEARKNISDVMAYDKQDEKATRVSVDDGSAWWIVFGLSFPIIGMLLCFLWIDKKPACAKKNALGAFIGACVMYLAYFCFITLFFVLYYEDFVQEYMRVF